MLPHSFVPTRAMVAHAFGAIGFWWLAAWATAFAEYVPRTDAERQAYHFVMGGLTGFDENEAKARTERLRSAPPEIKKALLDIAHHYYRLEPDMENLVAAMALLGLREDISESENQTVIAEARRLANPDALASSSLAGGYLIGALIFMEKHPTPESEDLALRLLDDSYAGVHYDVFRTLKSIGTAKSVPHLKTALIRDRAKGGANFAPWQMDEMAADLAALEDRVAASAKRSDSTAQTQEPVNTSAVRADDCRGAPTIETPPLPLQNWIAWAIIVLTVVTGLWLRVRKS